MRFLATALPLLCLPALAVMAPAQVLIVDANNGPGTAYTSIADAATNAPDGAVLEVRPGLYSRFQIINKSLAVLGGAGVHVQGDLTPAPLVEIANLDSSRAVTLRGLTFGFIFGASAISCRDSAGAIVVDDCVSGTASPFGFGRLRATNCEHVYVRDCTFRAAGVFEAALECFLSNVAVTNSTIGSQAICARQGGGRLVLSNCTLESEPTIVNSTVCFLAGGHLTLNGNTTLRSGSPTPAPAATGTGTVAIDPSVQLLGAATPIEPTLTIDARRVPFVTASTAGIGGTASGTLQLHPGENGALFVGFPDAPEFFPGIQAPFWLADTIVQAIGNTPTLTGSYQVPNTPWVLGVQIVWQGATFGSGRAVEASNPVGYAHY